MDKDINTELAEVFDELQSSKSFIINTVKCFDGNTAYIGMQLGLLLCQLTDLQNKIKSIVKKDDE